ncbi:MAG: urea transporter [Rhodothermales bacterium]|jgi:urea transporter
MKSDLKAIFSSYSEVLFGSGFWLGLLIFAITLVNPGVAIAGLLAVLSAYLFARFVGMHKEFLASGYYTYNPLLVGLSVGDIFALSPLTLGLTVVAGIVAFMVTVATANIFATYFKLPILSVPFVIVSSLVYLVANRYSNLFIAPDNSNPLYIADFGLPVVISGYFSSLGALFFAPSVFVGIVLAIVILVESRILFLLSLIGFYVGAGTRALMLGSVPQAFGDPNNFNLTLVAMAIGVFVIPSTRNYLLAIILVAASTLIYDATSTLTATIGLPVFTLPFNITALLAIYLLGVVRYPFLPLSIGESPEHTLETWLASRLRYDCELRSIHLPFAGEWSVWQGFDGRWTHTGSWSHAYDFVITDDEGNTHRDGGDELEEFYCFRKPVLSPIRGTAIKVIDKQPDNDPGQVDETRNWGNLVLILEPRGFYVLIAHFAEDSISVAEGAWVERGTPLGKCGNSGYSPQPHIHIQVQLTPKIGDGTAHFTFLSYKIDKTYHAHGLPAESASVEALYVDKRLDGLTTFLLDDSQVFRGVRPGKADDEVTLTVRIAPDGTFFFESARGRLYFGRHEGTLYFYRVEGDDPWLSMLLLASPRMPLAYRAGLTWADYVPLGNACGGLRLRVARFLASFYHPLAEVRSSQIFVDPNSIHTQISAPQLGIDLSAELQFDSDGISRVRLGDCELRSVAHHQGQR